MENNIVKTPQAQTLRELLLKRRHLVQTLTDGLNRPADEGTLKYACDLVETVKAEVDLRTWAPSQRGEQQSAHLSAEDQAARDEWYDRSSWTK